MTDRLTHRHLLRVLLAAWPKAAPACRNAARKAIAVAREQSAAGDHFLAADSLWSALFVLRGLGPLADGD